MPFDDIQQQTGALSELSGMQPTGGQPTMGQPMGGQPMGPSSGMGGPGVDTPQEKQAVDMLMQAMQLMRQASTVDPSIRPLVDKFLPDTFLQFAQHYGFGEEAKMALKQAQMTQEKARAGALQGGQGPMQRPPVTGPPQAGSPEQNQMIEY